MLSRHSNSTSLSERANNKWQTEDQHRKNSVQIQVKLDVLEGQATRGGMVRFYS